MSKTKIQMKMSDSDHVIFKLCIQNELTFSSVNKLNESEMNIKVVQFLDV